jgi:hypothetical protein
MGSLRPGSSPSKGRWLSAKRALVDRSSGACFSNRKLSNKLSKHDWAHSANHQLARQVHQRHFLTLWDTNMMVLVSSFGCCVRKLLR